MWPSIEFETFDWEYDADQLADLSNTRRRRIGKTYEAAVAPRIAHEKVTLSEEITQRLRETTTSLLRFDEEQARRGYDLPALMLRSESSSSSQIERLTASVRNVALAELSPKAPGNAKLIAGNVAAMRKALSQGGFIDTATICAIHDALMAESPEQPGLRQEQVWIGTSSVSPHGAAFAPPHHSRVPAALDDLAAFSIRDDITPLAKAAILHAQFETIHPFTDGNGRTGRALLHRQLRNDEILLHATLPLSAGLLCNIDLYTDALNAYHGGEVEPIVERIIDATEVALIAGRTMATAVDAVLEKWTRATTERAGSAMWRLPALLIAQPVVDVSFVARNLGITDRAARSLVEEACNRGILVKMGNAKRGAFYQAADLLKIMEEACDLQSIRRIAAKSPSAR